MTTACGTSSIATRVPSPISPLPVARSAQWLAHRYDPVHDAVQFRLVPRDVHARATFLIDEYLGDDAPVILRRDEAVGAALAPGPVHFVFHSAFCLSTLLARAFDLPGKSMGLKEPVILNDIVGWRHRDAVPPQRVAPVVDGALRLLARPFAHGEATIIKPSNVVNALAPGMLTLRREARALLLHAPLPVYLRSVAKKGLDGRLWVRDLLVKLLRDGIVDLGFGPQDYLALTDLQVATVGWLAQHALFARMTAQFGERVRSLDSEKLLARPAEAIAAVAELYAITLTRVEVAGIVAGPAFTTHSKDRRAFDPTARDAEYDASAAAHGDEIDKVLVWADAVARGAGVAMVLPSPLIR